jgi:hypothetical protein
MNKQNGAIQSFDSFELASQFKNAMATFAPILAFTAVIKDFQSEAEARAFLDTYSKVPMPNALEANSSDSDDGKIAAEPRLEIARQKASQDVVVIDDVDQVPFPLLAAHLFSLLVLLTTVLKCLLLLLPLLALEQALLLLAGVYLPVTIMFTLSSLWMVENNTGLINRRCGCMLSRLRRSCHSFFQVRICHCIGP